MAYAFRLLSHKEHDMGQGRERAQLYRQRAAEMRQKAENAQTEELKASFVRLEAAWLRLAAAAEKGEMLEDLSDSDLTGNS